MRKAQSRLCVLLSVAVIGLTASPQCRLYGTAKDEYREYRAEGYCGV